MTSLSKKIFKIATPTIIALFVHSINSIVDLFWIGRLGPDALTGVALATFMSWIMLNLSMFIISGAVSMIAQAIGARNPARAADIAGFNVFSSLIAGAVVTVVGLFLCQAVIDGLGVSAMAAVEARRYLLVLILAQALYFGTYAQDAVFKAHGDTRTLLRISIFAISVNMILDPIFIFALNWGVTGAALATVAAYVVSFGCKYYILRLRKWLKWGFYSLGALWRMLKIGIPVGMSHLAWSVVYPLMSVFLTRMDERSVAALNIAHKAESFSYFISMGFMVAASALVGQSVGGRSLFRARTYTMKCLGWVIVILTPLAILYMSLAGPIMRIFSNDPWIVLYGTHYLWIVSFSTIFMGVEIVMSGVYTGYGQTRVYMLISIPLTLARIPFAYFAARYQLDVNVVWWGISITTVAKGVVLYLAYYVSRWNRKHRRAPILLPTHEPEALTR